LDEDGDLFGDEEEFEITNCNLLKNIIIAGGGNEEDNEFDHSTFTSLH